METALSDGLPVERFNAGTVKVHLFRSQDWFNVSGWKKEGFLAVIGLFGLQIHRLTQLGEYARFFLSGL